MQWFSIDTETRSITEVTEPTTVAKVTRIVGIAIGRWLLSGLPLPDCTATDGVSEQEAALDTI